MIQRKQSGFPYCFKIAQSLGKWKWKPSLICLRYNAAHFVTKLIKRARVKVFTGKKTRERSKKLSENVSVTLIFHWKKTLRQWKASKRSELAAINRPRCRLRVRQESMIRQWCVDALSVIHWRSNNQTSIDYRLINCNRWVSTIYRSTDSRLTYGPTPWSILDRGIDRHVGGRPLQDRRSDYCKLTFAFVVEAFIFAPYFTLLTSRPQ